MDLELLDQRPVGDALNFDNDDVRYRYMVCESSSGVILSE